MLKQFLQSFFISTLFLFPLLGAFENKWFEMQTKYKKLVSNLSSQKKLDLEKKFCHPYWQKQKKQMKNIILGKPNIHCWKQRPIGGTMVCKGFAQPQQYEICYFKKCIRNKTLDFIKQYKDTPFNRIPFECKEFNCSTNTLVHLFYTARIIEQQINYNTPIDNIIEFGGGYGNLARIFKSLIPNSTYIIVDLPEFIALQYLFLSSTLSDEKIIIHQTVPKKFEKGAINLVPVFFLKEIKFKTDLFISTFGLSEAPNYVQSLIKNQQFFNAKITYLTGQLDGWGKHGFENHNLILNALKSQYPIIQCEPLHYFSNLHSYEIITYKGINT